MMNVPGETSRTSFPFALSRFLKFSISFGSIRVPDGTTTTLPWGSTAPTVPEGAPAIGATAGLARFTYRYPW